MAQLRRFPVFSFLVAEGILYLAFLRRDLFLNGAGTTLLKFAGILLCFLFSLGTLFRGGSPLVAIAMGFTVCADGFLLLLNAHYAMGLLFFCLVQGCYFLRIRARGGKPWLGARMLLLLAALTALALLSLLTPLNCLALFYFTNFLCNVLSSFLCSPPGPPLFSMGLALFLCCDVCVGLYQGFLPLPTFVAEFVRVGMWAFYLPGQVLIALSAMTESSGGASRESK